MIKEKFIDLFAGIGGLSLPFRELGLECVFSSEIDKFAVETYFNNFNEMPKGNIREISETLIPSHDILLAGFPCQAFSIAGKRKGFNDDRGNLFYEIVRILSFHKPKAFLLENVKGLVNHDKGMTFKIIKDELTLLGYKIFYKVLNARDFGLPQNRERIYIVGFLNHNVVFTFPNKFNMQTQVSNILDSHVDQKYTISNKLWESHQERKIRNREKGNGFGYSLVYKDSKYTSTLSARYYKDGSEILLYQDNNNPRKLTPRECARLQGFNNNFKIVVSDNQAYKQFGNSVAVSVVREVAKKMMEALRESSEDFIININEVNPILDNNVLFYNILKLLIQSKVKLSVLLDFQELIKKNQSKDFNSNSWNETLNSFLKSKNKLKKIYELFLENQQNINNFFLFLDLAISLYWLKELLWKQVKIFTETKVKEKISTIADLLSLEYDINSMQYSYIFRVTFSLLLNMLIKVENNDNNFILNDVINDMLQINQKIIFLSKNNHLNSTSIFNLIINESVNQSIKSTAGSNYEERIKMKFINLEEKNIKILSHVHDSKIPSVEYDFIVKYGNFKIGISAKRTLRERYKQNLENISNLDVDAMLVVTLGIDLMEKKMNNILQKEGQYILVSQEIYNEKEFLQKNSRVFSSKDFTFSMLKL